MHISFVFFFRCRLQKLRGTRPRLCLCVCSLCNVRLGYTVRFGSSRAGAHAIFSLFSFCQFMFIQHSTIKQRNVCKPNDEKIKQKKNKKRTSLMTVENISAISWRWRRCRWWWSQRRRAAVKWFLLFTNFLFFYFLSPMSKSMIWKSHIAQDARQCVCVCVWKRRLPQFEIISFTRFACASVLHCCVCERLTNIGCCHSAIKNQKWQAVRAYPISILLTNSKHVEAINVCIRINTFADSLNFHSSGPYALALFFFFSLTTFAVVYRDHRQQRDCTLSHFVWALEILLC